MSGLKVITFSDRPLPEENLLLSSCQQNKLDHTVLENSGEWTANSIKIRLLYEFLQSEKDDQLLLITDAFDVLINASEDELTSVYQSLESDIVFAAEANFYFRNHSIKREYEKNYPPSPTIYRFLNSGTFMGTAKNILLLLEDIVSSNNLDLEDTESFANLVSDQYLYTKHFVDHSLSTDQKYSISLDYNHSLFEASGGRMWVFPFPHLSSIHSFNSYKLERVVLKFLRLTRFQNNLVDVRFDSNKKVFLNKKTQTNPLVIHLPGSWKHFGRIMDKLMTGKSSFSPLWILAFLAALLCYFVSVFIPVRLNI